MAGEVISLESARQRRLQDRVIEVDREWKRQTESQRQELGMEMNELSLDEIARKNRENTERLRRERAKQNRNVKRDYRLPTK
jgi:hypothetical protein